MNLYGEILVNTSHTQKKGDRESTTLLFSTQEASINRMHLT